MVHLESVTVDIAFRDQVLQQPDNAFQFARNRGVVIIIVQLCALRRVLPCVGIGEVRIVIADNSPPVAVPQPVGAIVDRFVQHVPGNHNAGIILIQEFKHALDIVFHAAQHHFPGHIRLFAVISLMEEGLRRLAVPYQHMAVHLDPVPLGESQERFSRVKMNRHRRFIPGFLQQFPACADVQHGIRFHLIFRSQDIELLRDQLGHFRIHKDGLGRRGTEIKLPCVDFLQAGDFPRFLNNHGSFCGLGFLFSLRSGHREIPDLKIQGVCPRCFHIQNAPFKIAGRICAGQAGPFSLGGSAEGQVFIGFHTAVGMGDGDHEAGAVHIVLLHFHAQLIQASLDQREIPSGRVPGTLAAHSLQRTVRRMEGHGAPAVPAVLVLGEVGCIDLFRVIRQCQYAASQQGQDHQKSKQLLDHVIYLPFRLSCSYIFYLLPRK